MKCPKCGEENPFTWRCSPLHAVNMLALLAEGDERIYMTTRCPHCQTITVFHLSAQVEKQGLEEDAPWSGPTRGSPTSSNSPQGWWHK